MKLTKISLAALVALGAFSSVASATPLEEAIKNVDLSGFARYRYTNTTEKASKSDRNTEAKHNFKIVTNFKAAIDDNFFGVLGLRYNASDGSGNLGNGGNPNLPKTDKTDTDGTFGVHQLYLGYTIGGTTITAGKQEIGSFFTDDAIGTGVRVVNQDIEGLTLTAFAFDALENGSETDGTLFKKIEAASALPDGYTAGNLYAAAVAGSYDPIGFQLWYASLTNVADLLGVEVAGNFAVTNDISIGAKAQYVNNNADYAAKNLDSSKSYTDGNFYAAELSASLFGVDLSAGYIGWKAKDHGITSFALEDKGQLIAPGELLFGDDAEPTDYTFAQGKGDFWYGTAGYTYDKYFAGVDYINGKVKYKDGTKDKYQEIVPRLAYQYNKKLKFSSFYSFLETKHENGNKDKKDKLRFEAKYSF
ncbi:major outer membrane protein [Campylobacter curvus]|uniref:major outer membrane protein n=1 Tax=Campylobacter curvus TaxID=200 RepID=UPI001470077D|nr:major outer membrane protein [Campylobacter curvus]